MAGLKFKIEIDAPPERVFSHLEDVTTHPSWSNPKANMTMEQTAGTGPGPTPPTAPRASSSASP